MSSPCFRLRAWTIGLTILVPLLLGLLPVVDAAPQVAPPATPVASDVDLSLYEAVKPEQRDAIVEQTAGRLSLYAIDATLNPAPNGGEESPPIVTGTQDLHFVNNTGEILEDLYFRFYANDPQYAEGGMEVWDVTVDGEAVTPELSVEDTVLRVALAEPLPEMGTVEVSMAFTATVPISPRQSYGMFAFTPETGTWALAHWYPVLAGYDPVTGWYLEPVSQYGDLIFSNTALFDVSLTAPDDLVVVTTGSQVAEETDGVRTVRRYVSGPVRDFTIVADDDFASVSEEVDGTLITSYYNPEHAEVGAEILTYAVQSMAMFNELFGEYPYQEFAVVEVPLRGALGVEFPQLIYMYSSFYDRSSGGSVPGLVDFVVAHEVAHQWWYGLVGNNQYVHAYLDEGIANYISSEVYFERQYDAAAAREQVNMHLKLPYLRSLTAGDDHVVDQPTDEFPSQSAYVVTNYSKAALGFKALREEIGDEAFFAGLRDYSERMRFDVAVPDDMRAAFEEASGRDLTEFWRSWFEAEEGHLVYSEDDLERVVRELQE